MSFIFNICNFIINYAIIKSQNTNMFSRCKGGSAVDMLKNKLQLTVKITYKGEKIILNDSMINEILETIHNVDARQSLSDKRRNIDVSY